MREEDKEIVWGRGGEGLGEEGNEGRKERMISN